MDCPYLRFPMYHSGFTGKSGEETWWRCERKRKWLRHIKSCELSGNAELMKETYIHDRSKK